MDDPWRDLRLNVADGGAGTWLEWRGELDVASVPTLRHHLSIVIDAGIGDVYVDMAGVTFGDSTTLCVLVEARQQLAATGRRMRVVDPSRRVRRLLRVADVAQLLA